jgi:hypothetical protein
MALGRYETDLKIEAIKAKVSTLLAENYLDTHGAWAEGHLELLCEIRRVVGNDLDKIIILGVIGQRMFQTSKFKSKEYGELAGGNFEVDHPRLTNIESISSSTGIPRESVRRKVMELIAQGWIERDQSGKLFVLPQAASDLEECTMIERNFIVATIAQILTFVEQK